MTEVRRGRVLSHASGTVTKVAVQPRPEATTACGRRVPSEVVEAHEEARRIVARAEERATAILHEAEHNAEERKKRAEDEGVAEATARLAAGWLALRAREEAASSLDLGRAIDLAMALAERVVGMTIEADSKTLVPMAERALREARGARAVVIEAHPLDAAPLREHLAFLSLPEASLELRENESLARGDLLFHTDLGTLDARIRPQLERLEAALRDLR